MALQKKWAREIKVSTVQIQRLIKLTSASPAHDRCTPG